MPRSSHVLLLVCLYSLSLFAQSDRATITGRVLDATGASVPEAAVTATNSATNVKYVTKSSETGNFIIPQLPVGAYEVSVEAKGFRRSVQKEVTLNIAQTVTLNVSLEVGQVDQSIEISAQPPQLETSTSDMGTVVSNKLVLDLPLAVSGNMRNPEAFIFLTPGVSGTTDNTQINGGQSRSKEVLLDGIGSTSPESGGLLFTYPSVEALSEFKLVSANFNAEYGRSGSGFEVYTTKSGTNQYHGSAFDYLRNNVFDARGFYAPTTPINRQNEFGGSIGGPLSIPKVYDGKNKTFFFFNYTGFRFRAGALNTLYTLPTDAMRNGDFSNVKDRNGKPIQIYDPNTTRPAGSGFTRDLFPNAQIPLERFSTVSKNIIRYLPANTYATQLNNFLSVGAQTFDKDQVNFRIDQNFAEKNRLSFFAYLGTQDNVDPEKLPVPFTPSLDTTRLSKWLRLNDDHVISATTLNHFIAGFTREGQYFQHLSVDQGWPDTIGLTGVQTGEGNTFPKVTFSDGLTNWRDEVKTKGAQVNNAFQVNDSLSSVHGNHNMKAGVEARWLQTNGGDPFNQMGTFGFNSVETALPTAAGRTSTGSSFASFLLGLTDSASYNGLYVVPAARYKNLSFFAQDDWKVSRTLTLNLGLRYDIYFARTEHYNNFSGFDPALANPGAGGNPGAIAFLGDGTGRDSSRDSFANTDYNNVGPRFGLAWAPNEKTAIRGGYGIYYAPGNATVGLRTSQNFSLGFNAAPAYTTPDQGLTPAVRWDNGFPTNWPKPPFIDPTVGNGTNVNMIGADDGRPPYIQNWSFNIQRSLPWGLFADVGYVGVKGTRLGTSLIRMNEVDPKYLSLGSMLQKSITSPEAIAAGIPLPYPGFKGTVAQALRPFPQILNIDNRSNPNGNSTYHALQAKIERRMRSGFSFLGVYTYSKTISDGNIMAGLGIDGQTYYNRTMEKAIATTDVPHIVAVSAMYELPFGKGQRYLTSGIASRVAGGWSLTGILQYSSGLPLVLTANNTLPLFNSVLRPDVVFGADKTVDVANFDPAVNRWITPGAFVNPQPLHFGTSSRSFTDLRSPWNMNESFGVLKSTPLTERVTLVFRAEFFNALNRVVFGGIASNVSSANFGTVSSQANTPRQGQLALRLEF
jgi:hypothetical protein